MPLASWSSCRAAPIGVIGDVTGSEVETMTRRSDPRKGSPPRPSITFDSTMSSGIYIAGEARIAALVVDPGQPGG